MEDSAVREIVEAGRRTRRKTPRAVWITALLVGTACAVAFVLILLRDPAPAGSAPAPRAADRGPGFSLGLVLGLAVGVALGLAIARGRTPDLSRTGQDRPPDLPQ